MKHFHSFLSLAVVVSMAFALVPASPFSLPTARAETLVFEEGWETVGTPGWELQGTLSLRDCTVARQGLCSLRLDPQFNDQGATARRPHPLALGPAPYNLSFQFRHSNTDAPTEGAFFVNLSGGAWLRLELTYGSANNQLAFSSSLGSGAAFHTYTSGAWVHARVRLDHVADVAWAEVLNAAGQVVKTSPVKAIPAASNDLEGFGFQSAYTGQSVVTQPPKPIHVDDVRLVTASAPDQRPLLAATAGPGAGQVSLAWLPPSSDGGSPITHYNVYRGTASGARAFLAQVGTNLSYLDAGLPNGTTYYYDVRAVNVVGEGLPSLEASARTFRLPGPVASFIATPGVQVGDVRLSWTMPSDTGGAPITGYAVYRGDSAGNETLLTTLGNVTVFADRHVPNGTLRWYRVVPVNVVGEGPMSPSVSSHPRADSAPPASGLLVQPDPAWVGHTLDVRFTYDATVSQCAVDQECPVPTEWRVWLDGTPGTHDGLLLATNTSLHPGHAERVTYQVRALALPQVALGPHLLKIAVSPRVGSETWSWTERALVFEQGEAGRVFDLVPPTVLSGASAPDQAVTLRAAYTAYQKVCPPTETCDVPTQWALLFGGTPGLTDGTRLAGGWNDHSAHGDNLTFTVEAEVRLPSVNPGSYPLKLVARANATAEWSLASSNVTLAACYDSGERHRYVHHVEDLPEGSRKHARELRLVHPDYVTKGPIQMYDACPTGDGKHELSINGAIVDAMPGRRIFVVDRSGYPTPFVLGSDVDLSGAVGDSPLDCLQGPFWIHHGHTCPSDAHGKVGVFVLNDLDRPWLGVPPVIPLYSTPSDVGQIVSDIQDDLFCRDCFLSEVLNDPGSYFFDPINDAYWRWLSTAPPLDLDEDYDGYGDTWTGRFPPDAAKQLGSLLDDLDGDELSNFREFQWDTIPFGFFGVFPNAEDFDDDQWKDGPEVAYWNNPANDQPPAAWDYARLSRVAVRDPDRDVEYYNDSDTLNTVADPDVDDDGLEDGFEHAVLRSYPHRNHSDCAFGQPCAPPGASHLDDTYQHADDVLHAAAARLEFSDNTEYHAWISIPGLGAQPWLSDVDGDLLPPLVDPDSDGDELLDGDEWHRFAPVNGNVPLAGQGVQTFLYYYDSDEDGLLDGANVTLLPGDARWTRFEAAGITYVTSEGGARTYLGEAGQRTHPLDDDSDDDTIKDGDEAPGVHPARVSSIQDAYAQMQADAYITFHDETQTWLNGSRAGNTGLGSITAGAAVSARELVTGIGSNLTTLTPPDPLSLLPLANVTDVVGCVADPNAPPAPPDPASVIPALQCVVGGLRTLLLDPLLSGAQESIEHIGSAALDTVDDIVDELPVQHLPVTLPVAEILDARSLVRNGVLSGGMPTPDAPWEAGGPQGPGPFEGQPWNTTPYPQLFNDLVAITREHPALFERIDQAASDPVIRQAVGGVDSTHFNVVVELEGNPTPLVFRNRPMGTTFIDFQDTENVLPLGADLTVRAEFTTGAALTQSAVVSVTDMALGGGTKASVAVFMLVPVPVPGQQYVVGLANDARTQGLPASFELSLGTNALQQALAQRPAYDFRIVTTGTSRAGNYGASYFPVDNDYPVKNVMVGNRSEIGLSFPEGTPASVRGLFEENAAGALRVEWTAQARTRLEASAASWQVDEFRNPVREYSLALAASLPRTLTTDIQRGQGTFDIVHTADEDVRDLDIVWGGRDPAADPGRSRYQGGLDVTTFPTSVTLRFDAAASTLTYSGSSPLGHTNFTSLETDGEVDDFEACNKVEGALFLTHFALPHGACMVGRIYGLTGITGSFGQRIDLTVERADRAGRFVVGFDTGAVSLYADATQWPTQVRILSTRTPASWTLYADLAGGVDKASVSYRTGEEALSAVIDQVPSNLTFSADFSTGTTKVTSVAATPIADISARFGATVEEYDATTLGDNDGVVLRGQGGTVLGGALRLRGFKSADLRASEDAGIELVTDSTSTAPFRIRWSDGPSWLDADLERLPRDVRLTQVRTETSLVVTYRSTEVIPQAKGLLTTSDGVSGLYLNLTNLPKSIDVEASFPLGTAKVVADSPIEFLEVARTGPDGTYDDAVAYDNYVLLQREVGADGQVKIPRFHVRVQDFQSFDASIANLTVDVKASFANATPGTFAARYRGPEGWLDANVTTDLPPDFRLGLTRAGFAWTATEGFSTSSNGGASFAGFRGSWDLQGIPSRMQANWSSAGGRFAANASHSAGAPIPKIYVDGNVQLSEGAPASHVHLDARQVPARLAAWANLTERSVNVSFHDHLGQPTGSGSITLSYAEDASLGRLTFSQGPPMVAYARMRTGEPQEAFFRVDGLKRVSVQGTQAGPEGLVLDYEGASTSAYLDVQGDGGFRIHGTMDELPATLRATVLLQRQAGVFELHTRGSAAIDAWSLDLLAEGYRVQGSGKLPAQVDVTGSGTDLDVVLSENATLTVLLGPQNVAFAPSLPGLDYVVADLSHPDGRIAAHVTNLREVHVDGALGTYDVRVATPRTIHLDVALGGGNYVRGEVQGLPSTLHAEISPALDKISWRASSRTTLVDLDGYHQGKAFRVYAEDVPSQFDLQIDLPGRKAFLDTFTSGAFGLIDAGYGGDAAQEIPVLPSDGFHVDVTEGDDLQRVRAAVRITGVVSAHVERGVATQVHLVRNLSGGAFSGVFLSQEEQVELSIASLPKELHVDVSNDADLNSVHADVRSGSEALGAVTASYRKGNAVGFDVEATGLSAVTVVDFSKVGAVWDASYTSDPATAGNATLKASGRGSDGRLFSADLTSLPVAFQAFLDPVGQEAHFTTTTGSLTGHLFAGASGKTLRGPPEGGMGGSISLGSSDLHLDLAVDGLVEAHMTRVGERDVAHVTFAQASTKALDLSFVRDDMAMRVAAGGVPQELSFEALFAADAADGLFEASSSLPWAVVDARVNRSDTVFSAQGRIENVPTKLVFDVRQGVGNEVKGRVETTGGASTKADVTITDVKGRTLHAKAQGFPALADFMINPDNNTATGGCVADVDLSSPITSLEVTMGRGEPRAPQFASRPDQWVSVDIRDPKEPTVHAKVLGAKYARVCFGEASLDVEADIATGADLLAITYRDPDSFVDGELGGVEAGVYDVQARANGVTYVGAEIDSVFLRGHIPWEVPLFERPLVNFNVIAHDVPAYASATIVDRTVTLDTASQPLGILLADIMMAPTGWTKRSAMDFLKAGIAVDGDRFRSNYTLVQITDGAEIPYGSDAPQRVALRLDSATALGVEFRGWSQGRISFDLDHLDLQVEDLRVRQGDRLTARLKLPDEMWFPLVNVDVSDTPEGIDIHTFFDGNPIKIARGDIPELLDLMALTLKVDPTHRVGAVEVYMGTEDGLGGRLQIYGVQPVEEDMFLSLRFDGAVGIDLGNFEGFVEGIALVAQKDDAHWVRMALGKTKAFDLRADIDGARDHQGSPEVFDLRTFHAEDLRFETRWGDDGIVADHPGIYLLGTGALIVTPAIEAGVEAVRFTAKHIQATAEGSFEMLRDGISYVAAANVW